MFNHEVGIDVLEVKDAAGRYFDILNAAGGHRETNGVPSSSICLDAFVKGWVRSFGWLKLVAADRSTHSRRGFAQTVEERGTNQPCCTGNPKQIGRVERRNQTLKQMLNK